MICKLKYLEEVVEFPFSFTKDKQMIFIEIKDKIVLYLFKHGDHLYSYDGFLYNYKFPFVSYKTLRTKKELINDLQAFFDRINENSFQVEDIFSISY